MANRDIEARLKLSAVDKTGAAFKSLSGKLNAVDRQAKAFNRSNSMLARSTAASYTAMARFAAPAVLAYGVANATKRFAEVEDRIARIGITADASAEKTKGVLAGVQRIASDMAMPVDDVAMALETLVASGQSLDEAMAFLPSVVKSAQASGSATADLATTADAVSRSLGIMGDKSQLAFDIMAKGGKAGKFELRDMAQYLPSIIPAFSAMGYRGEKSLGKLVAMLQTVRNYTGDSSEAATSLMNVFQKMESEETAKKFSKFGIDLRKEMTLAKKEGRDLIDTFVQLSLKATKGDLSKLPQLFTDAQFLAGMRALILGRDATAEMAANLKDAAGTVQNDFNRVIDLTQQKLTKLSSSWDKFMTNVGSVASDLVVPGLDKINADMDQAQYINRALEKRGLSWWEQKKWWATNGFNTHEQGLVAFSEGWRSPEGKVAAAGPMSASPELPSRRQDQPGPVPIPTPRPAAMSVAEQYTLYGRGRAAAVRNDAYGARAAEAAARSPITGWANPDPNAVPFSFGRLWSDLNQPVGRAGANPEGFDADELGRKLQTGFSAAGSEIEQGGERAGSKITEAARAINDAGGEAANTFRSMIAGIGKQFGAEAAAAFNATAKAPGGGVVGRPPVNVNTGSTMPNAGVPGGGP